MTVQARFYVAEITRYAYNPDQAQVTLRAVSRGEENKTWAAATPAGEMKMTIGNPAAVKWFEERLGKDVALGFEDRQDACVDCGGNPHAGLGQYQTGIQVGPDKYRCGACHNKRQSQQ